MRLLPVLLLSLATIAAAPPAGERDRGLGMAGERRGDATVYRVANFDAVAIGTAGDAQVRVGPAWSLRIAGPAEAIADLRVVVERGRLEIGHRWRDRQMTPAERRLRIEITLPRLRQAALGGSGHVTVDRVSGGDFSAAVGGSGDMAIGQMAVDKATISIGGSGRVTAAGTARALQVNIGGSGDLAAPALRATTATVAAAGSGRVRARVDGDAQVTLVGSGSVDLGADARCRVTRMGSGQVRCGA